MFLIFLNRFLEKLLQNALKCCTFVIRYLIQQVHETNHYQHRKRREKIHSGGT